MTGSASLWHYSRSHIGARPLRCIGSLGKSLVAVKGGLKVKTWNRLEHLFTLSRCLLISLWKPIARTLTTCCSTKLTCLLLLSGSISTTRVLCWDHGCLGHSLISCLQYELARVGAVNSRISENVYSAGHPPPAVPFLSYELQGRCLMD